MDRQQKQFSAQRRSIAVHGVEGEPFSESIRWLCQDQYEQEVESADLIPADNRFGEDAQHITDQPCGNHHHPG